jgi:ATP-dependent helicase IRC3
MSDNTAHGLMLRDYQESTVAAAIAPKDGVWRRLLVLATGGGKTVIAAEIINRVLAPGQKALFLAHRDELLTQAKAEIEGFIPGINVEIEQAENRASRESGIFDADRRHVVVGSVQTMQRDRLQSWASDAFSLVIIDEAHHGAATSYRNIVEHFGCLDDAQRVPLIGVTATPMRTDKVGLDVLFQEISAVYGISALVEKGYLADIRAISIETETDLRGVKTRAGDYAQGELQDAVDTDDRNALIVAAHRKYAADRPTLVFASGVEHAQHLAELFSAYGVPAEAMWGAMGDDERRDTLARYASGATKVLTNFALLTEGFNAPATSCIILARPTKSELLYTQMIGRGTRLHPGKDHLLVLDLRDVTNGKNLFSAASLAGLPASFDLKGKSMFKAAKDYAELQKLAPLLAAKSMTPEEVEKNIQLALDLIRAREIEILQHEERRKSQVYASRFLWYRVGDYHFEITPDKGATYYKAVCDVEKPGEPWHIAMREGSGPWQFAQKQYFNTAEAIEAADRCIARTHRNTAIIERNAPWTREPATPKQISALRKFREIVPQDISKGEASLRLNALFARKALRYGHQGAAQYAA